MSKIKETIKNEVEDHYVDHPTHRIYDEQCSECFKNVRDFDMTEADKEIEQDIIRGQNESIEAQGLPYDFSQEEIDGINRDEDVDIRIEDNY